MRRAGAAFASLVVAAGLLVPSGAGAEGNEQLAETFRGSFRGGGVTSEGVGLATRVGGPASGAITIDGVPPGAVVQRAFLYWVVLAGEDSLAELNGQPVSGTLIGRSADTCWFSAVPDPADDNRAYRAEVTGLVDANGTYTVGGVGAASGQPGGDGQGASLVVVYSVPAAERSATIVINDGAMTAGPIGPHSLRMSHTFSGVDPGGPVDSLRLHVGMGDTSVQDPDGSPDYTIPEDPMTFAGAPVTPVGFFDGSDGPQWDDHTIDLPTSLLAAGTNQASNEIAVRDDCMVWTYAALEIVTPPPPVEITSPAPGIVTNADPVAIAGTAAPAVASVRVREGASVIGTVPVSGGAWQGSFAFGDGTHTVSATGVSANGAELPQPREVTFTVDTAAPEVEITSPRGAGAGLTSIQVRGTASDGHAVASVLVTYTKFGSNVQDGSFAATCTDCGTPAATFVATLALGRGLYLVRAVATDAAGNSSASAPVVVVLGSG